MDKAQDKSFVEDYNCVIEHARACSHVAGTGVVFE